MGCFFGNVLICFDWNNVYQLLCFFFCCHHFAFFFFLMEQKEGDGDDGRLMRIDFSFMIKSRCDLWLFLICFNWLIVCLWAWIDDLMLMFLTFDGLIFEKGIGSWMDWFVKKAIDWLDWFWTVFAELTLYWKEFIWDFIYFSF